MKEPLLYSQRQALSTGNAVPLQTESLPQPFRNQIAMLLTRTIGRYTWDPDSHDSWRGPQTHDNVWFAIWDGFRFRRGMLSVGHPRLPPDQQCLQFIINETDVLGVIDLVETALRFIDKEVRTWNPQTRQRANVDLLADEAFAEFNYSAQLAGVGFSFTNGEIVPVSSSYIHSQAVEPALLLLRGHGFAAAEQEFMRAHAALRQGDYPAVFTEAVKAFESTMKVIIQRKGWSCAPNATAKPLISCLEKNGLFPNTLQTQFSHFLDLLASGVPTLGNNYGRHGAGEAPHSPPRELAEYALNLTASNIVFLVARC